MASGKLELRLAYPEEVGQICQVISDVSDGMVESLFASSGVENPVDVLQLAFLRKISPFLTWNVNLVVLDGQRAGMLFGYAASDTTDKTLVKSFLGEKKVEELSDTFLCGSSNAYWINTLWVNPSLRRQGIGTLLLNCADYLANKSGLQRVALHCWADNHSALEFYKKNQFSVVRSKQSSDDLKGRHPMGSLTLERGLQCQG